MENTMKMYITADEAAEILGVSRGYAYKIIRGLNNELKEKGYRVISGKVPTKYFEEKSHILREEWGFCGYVVTDWGDMDIVVDGADAISAGNDVIMPGGPPVIRQILRGVQENRLSREALEKAVEHLLQTIGV